MKRLLMALSIAALGLTFAGQAQAFTQTTTGTLAISVTKTAACTVTTAPLDFGTYDGSASVYNNTTITVNCSNGTAYRVDIDAGLNSTTVGRYVKHSTTTDIIFYKLGQDSTLATQWGDNGATFCATCTTVPQGLTGTGSGADQVLTVYAGLWPSTRPVGTYGDIVTVTVNY